MPTEKDRLGEKLHDVEQAREDQYFRNRDKRGCPLAGAKKRRVMFEPGAGVRRRSRATASGR